MKFAHLRLAVLAGAFGLLVAIPLLAFHLQTTFLQGWYQSLSIGGCWKGSRAFWSPAASIPP